MNTLEKPAYKVVLKNGQEFFFFTYEGASQWLRNVKEEGRYDVVGAYIESL